MYYIMFTTSHFEHLFCDLQWCYCFRLPFDYVGIQNVNLVLCIFGIEMHLEYF